MLTIMIILTSTATSAYALRGYFTPTNEFQAFSLPTNQLTPIYSFALGNSTSLSTNSFTIFSNPQSQNATALDSTLYGSFFSTNTVAVTFQENVNVNVSQYSYFQVSTTTTPDFSSSSGFGFGLRFLATLTNGSVVQLSNDKLPVEHVKSGGTTTLKVYVPNYEPGINEIIGIRLYAEERASVSSDYSIRINSIVASSLNKVPSCTSAVCYIPINLPNGTGYFDTLVVDTVFTGASSYRVALSYTDQLFFSAPYSNGSSHVSINPNSLNAALEIILLASTPSVSPALLIISATPPTSVRLENLKLTFTPVPVPPFGLTVPVETYLELLFVEIVMVFAVPAELLILRRKWWICLVLGIVVRIVMMPWTGHSSDTTLLIRTAYLWYHEGWGPLFYNPPTIFALSSPVGSMQFYYLLGLNQNDPSFLFHYGGILATFFVKLPFLLADVASAVMISRLSQNKMSGMFYFLNPFSIYISALWGQYEGLTTFALILGYVGFAKLRPKLSGFVGFGGFLLAGLVELFGFFVIPLMMLYLAIKKRFFELVLPILVTIAAILIPSSLSAYVFSFSISNPLFRPNIYSLSGNFGIHSPLPLISAVVATIIIALGAVFRTDSFLNTIAPVSAAIFSFQLLAFNHPQFSLIPIGLLTLFFAWKHDTDGLIFVWICGAILAFVTIVGTQSFAYLLTGQGYYLIPLVEAGHHLQFYAIGLLTIGTGLVVRAYRKLPVLEFSALIALLVALGWYAVNFV